MSLQDDPQSRYKIESVIFAEDLGSIVVDFQDPDHQSPPILERTQWAVDLREDSDMRDRIIGLYDELCDVLDDAYRAQRLGKQARLP